MARKKLSEFKAKSLLLPKLDLPYQGLGVRDESAQEIQELDRSKTYVVKVDQGIKKRYKLGLLELDVEVDAIPEALKKLREKGYTQFIIEPFQTHPSQDERYLALQRMRDGFAVTISSQGGVDIEENKDTLQQFILPQSSSSDVASALGVQKTFIERIIQLMDEYHISFLEINPLVVTHDQLFILDLAVEVDSAGAFFVQNAWTDADFVTESGKKSPEEETIDELSFNSQASFRLVVLNPDGAIFMLLSGGGASIVLADEVYNQGEGRLLANYGEYSGNPSAEETYLYTKQVLSLLLQSKSPRKVLIIAGGVANFTDIRVTFRGIIKALQEVNDRLREQQVKVYVRRGGPYQEEGLAMMKSFLQEQQLLGQVSGPEIVLTDIVTQALKEVRR